MSQSDSPRSPSEPSQGPPNVRRALSYAPELQPVTPVYLIVNFRNSVYKYIAVTVAGRHTVFPAPTDGTHTLSDNAPMLFSLPVKANMYFLGGLHAAPDGALVTSLGLDAVAMVLAECNDGFVRPGMNADRAFASWPVERQALAVWIAQLGASISTIESSHVDLEDMRLCINELRTTDKDAKRGVKRSPVHDESEYETNPKRRRSPSPVQDGISVRE